MLGNRSSVHSENSDSSVFDAPNELEDALSEKLDLNNATLVGSDKFKTLKLMHYQLAQKFGNVKVAAVPFQFLGAGALAGVVSKKMGVEPKDWADLASSDFLIGNAVSSGAGSAVFVFSVLLITMWEEYTKELNNHQLLVNKVPLKKIYDDEDLQKMFNSFVKHNSKHIFREVIVKLWVAGFITFMIFPPLDSACSHIPKASNDHLEAGLEILKSTGLGIGMGGVFHLVTKAMSMPVPTVLKVQAATALAGTAYGAMLAERIIKDYSIEDEHTQNMVRLVLGMLSGPIAVLTPTIYHVVDSKMNQRHNELQISSGQPPTISFWSRTKACVAKSFSCRKRGDRTPLLNAGARVSIQSEAAQRGSLNSDGYNFGVLDEPKRCVIL